MEFICLYIITFAAIMYITKPIWEYIIEVKKIKLAKKSIEDMLIKGITELIEQEERGKKNVKSNSKKKR